MQISKYVIEYDDQTSWQQMHYAYAACFAYVMFNNTTSTYI